MKTTMHRLEVTITPEQLARLDEVRQYEPRASFVKRALASALSEAKDPSAPKQAAPGSVDRDATSRSVRAAAPTRTPATPDPPAEGMRFSRTRPQMGRQAALNKSKGL